MRLIIALLFYIATPTLAITGGRVDVQEAEKLGKGIAPPDLGIDFTPSIQLRKRSRPFAPVKTCTIKTETAVHLVDLDGKAGKQQAGQNGAWKLVYSKTQKVVNDNILDVSKRLEAGDHDDSKGLAKYEIHNSNRPALETTATNRKIPYMTGGRGNMIQIFRIEKPNTSGNPFPKQSGPLGNLPKKVEAMSFSRNNRQGSR